MRPPIKAFLMNRIGDVGLVLALAAIALTFDSLTFDAVFDAAGSTSATLLGLPALEVIGVLLLVGAMGKSAQIGLHTWLADAMEGPTPVSALLHAATMVTAGVFLVARCAPLYAGAPVALDLVAAVGAVTALFAATIALAQTDIKRVVAWSTCSQLGYMFLAAGVAVPAAALFHLFTHAFFKALLFLGAGAVIHALAHEQDLRRMGGLARRMPLTCAAMVIGSLALSGLPRLPGSGRRTSFWKARRGARTGRPGRVLDGPRRGVPDRPVQLAARVPGVRRRGPGAGRRRGGGARAGLVDAVPRARAGRGCLRGGLVGA